LGADIKRIKMDNNIVGHKKAKRATAKDY